MKTSIELRVEISVVNKTTGTGKKWLALVHCENKIVGRIASAPFHNQRIRQFLEGYMGREKATEILMEFLKTEYPEKVF